jgi:hypothetical protein
MTTEQGTARWARLIEIWNLKWPRRKLSVAIGSYLGEDQYGHWVGQTKGAPWWSPDHSQSGVFTASFVLLIPHDAYWTACFNSSDPLFDVDIALPVQWNNDVIEIIDLELDVLRFTDGNVIVRDQEEFAQTRDSLNMPEAIAKQAESACAYMFSQLEQSAEPFGSVGDAWLSRFLTDLSSSEY